MCSPSSEAPHAVKSVILTPLISAMFVSFSTLFPCSEWRRQGLALQTQQRKRDVVAGGIDERQGIPSATGRSLFGESGRTILGPIRLDNREQAVPIRTLQKAEWRSYLDRIALALISRPAPLQIPSPRF